MQSQSKIKKPKVQKGWKNANPAFAHECARYMVVGTSNTGKTTLAVKIIKHIIFSETDPHHVLIIISPHYQKDKKIRSLATEACEKGLEVRVYQSLDKTTLNKFMEYINECSSQDKRSLVFVDDPVGVGGFTSNVNQKSPWNSFVSGCKHYFADIVFSTQSVAALSKVGRENVDVFVYLPSMVYRDELYNACRFVSTRSDFDKLMDTYASEPYHALWINAQFGRKGVYAIDADGTISPISSIPK